jgi:hypothetical protein
MHFHWQGLCSLCSCISKTVAHNVHVVWPSCHNERNYIMIYLGLALPV